MTLQPRGSKPKPCQVDEEAEIELAWNEEIRRRLAELDAGAAETIPAEQLFTELNALLEK